MDPEKQAKLDALKGDQKMGQFFQASGNQNIRDIGKSMSDNSTAMLEKARDRKAAADLQRNKYRAKINLGKGITYDPNTDTTSNNEAYDEAVRQEQAYKTEFQKQKDAEALKRANLIQFNNNPKMTAGVAERLGESQRLVNESQSLLDNWESGSVHAGVDTATSFIEDGMLSPFKPMIENAAYTPAQQYQRARSSQLESSISKLMAGLALTGFELGERKKWSPFAPGLTDAQSKQRLGIINEIFREKIATTEAQFAQPDQNGGDGLSQTMEAINATDPAAEAVMESAVVPVGPPRTVSDGSTWQRYSDGSTKQVN